MSDPVEIPAAERLALTRERMRQSMIAVMPPKRSQPPALGDTPRWLDGLKSIPGAELLIDVVRSWWAQHPMRLASMVGLDAGKTLIRPLAQRHPIGLVMGAVLVGGLLAWAKPWRGLLKPALFAGLLPQLASRAMAHIPIQSWLSVLATVGEPPRHGTPAQQPPAAASPSAASGDKPMPAGTNSASTGSSTLH